VSFRKVVPAPVPGETSSTARRLYHKLRSRLPGADAQDYYRDPAGYWEERHAHYGERLEGVGRKGLGEEGNQRDYGVKTEHLHLALTELGIGPVPFLDAGCGIGLFSQYLAEQGYTPTAVDFSPSAVETARQRLGQDAVVVSALDQYQAGRTFALVICIDVLFHLVDDDLWRATVTNLADHVASGGHLAIQESLVETAAQPQHPTVRHTRWRPLASYTDVLAGWELVRHDHYRLPAEGETKDLLVFCRP
jgi:2-polyprenyl-3-methyl-5-hydroxy-6-metoxy-1,4-benzoquinol methylase